MCTITESAPTVKANTCRLVLEVNGVAYRVRPIPPGYTERAYSLRKADGTVYHAAYSREDGHTCSCPDCIYRDHACKHLLSLAAVGLLPPIPGDAREPADADADAPAPTPAGSFAEELAESVVARLPEPMAPATVTLPALQFAHLVDDAASDAARGLAFDIHQSDAALGRKVTWDAAEVAAMRARREARRLAPADRPADRLIRVESDGADATMRALGFARRGDGWEKRVPAKDRPTGLSDFDRNVRRWCE